MVFCLCGRPCFSKTLVINPKGIGKNKNELRPTYHTHKINGLQKPGISLIAETQHRETPIESKEKENENAPHYPVTNEVSLIVNEPRAEINAPEDTNLSSKPSNGITTSIITDDTIKENEKKFTPEPKKQKAPQRPKEVSLIVNEPTAEINATEETNLSSKSNNGITKSFITDDTIEENENKFTPEPKKQKVPERPFSNKVSSIVEDPRAEISHTEEINQPSKANNGITTSFITDDNLKENKHEVTPEPKKQKAPQRPVSFEVSLVGENTGQEYMTKSILKTRVDENEAEKEEEESFLNNNLKEESDENIYDEDIPKNSIDKPKKSIDLELGLIGRREGIAPIPTRIDENMEKIPVYIKDPNDGELIKKAIEKNDFLNQIISAEQLKDVVAAMYNKEISSKDVVIKQGDKGSNMYVSAKGTFQIIVNGKVVNEFKDIRVFGELAILYNATRQATIKAVTSGRVWVLDSNVYQQIMIRHNIKKQDELMNFLVNNEILNVVGNEALQIVSNLLKSEFFKSGQVIVRQGDRGDKFYIIRAGTVTITKEGEGVVGVYKKGDCFGELALLEEDSRQATVTANAPGVECLTLTRREFIDHFGDIKKFKYIKVKESPKVSIISVRAEHDDVNLKDLRIIKTLGVGGFGRVELVQHTKIENLIFALKYLKKIEVVQQNQQEHVYNEKVIQMTSRSPFIVRLYRTYKDTKYIYFLMESCLGGDLWSLLQKQKSRRFEEKDARFICACVVEAFDYLHSRDIIYRDLKPENLLISSNGYIKLTDFGFAKKIAGRGKTYTFAGTPEYVAPEIVLNRGHDKAVDYWAFGAFVFEMLSGRTPFRTDDSSHMRTYNKILSGIDNVQFPTYINLKARHLIEKLCRPVPSERLGMQRRGIQDIKTHKWFLGLDWQKLCRGDHNTPFKPKLIGAVDTRYFEHFKRDTDNPPEELSGWDENF